MSRVRSLRNRVALSLAAFGGVLTLALAATIYVWFQHLETRLIDDGLMAELRELVERRARNPGHVPEQSESMRAYVFGAGQGQAQVPAEVRALSAGSHDLELAGSPYRALLKDIDGVRYAFLYNETRMRQRERGFLGLLVFSVLGGTLVSALAGRWVAGRTISPLTDLVRRVAKTQPERGVEPRLEGRYPWEEVRRLAADFDCYIRRLQELIERERLFADDVSHELRTPLAVMKGVVELLLADPALNEVQCRRVARLERGVTQMEEITTALLALARNQGVDGHQSCVVATVAEDVLERHRRGVADKPVRLSLLVEAQPDSNAPPAVLGMVLSNLLRNALSVTERGAVVMTIRADSVLVEDTGPGIGDRDIKQLCRPYVRGTHSEGTGLGLSLVQRFCQRQGWEISLSNRPEGGTRALLVLGAGKRPEDCR